MTFQHVVNNYIILIVVKIGFHHQHLVFSNVIIIFNILKLFQDSSSVVDMAEADELQSETVIDIERY